MSWDSAWFDQDDFVIPDTFSRKLVDSKEVSSRSCSRQILTEYLETPVSESKSTTEHLETTVTEIAGVLSQLAGKFGALFYRPAQFCFDCCDSLKLTGSCELF